MLRIGTKYDVDLVRDEAVRRLRQCFPEDLDRYVTPHTSSKASESKSWSNTRYCFEASTSLSHEDCIGVINLARSFDLDDLLPAALYACAQLPKERIIEGYTNDRGELSVVDKKRVMGHHKLNTMAARMYTYAFAFHMQIA